MGLEQCKETNEYVDYFSEVVDSFNDGERFINILHHAHNRNHAGFIIRTIIEAEPNADGKKEIHNYASKDVEEISDYENILKKFNAGNVYVTLNEFRGLKRLTANVHAINGFYIDLDGHDFTEEELAFAIEKTKKILNDAWNCGNFLRPTMITFTGRGLGLYFILNRSIANIEKLSGVMRFYDLIYTYLIKAYQALISNSGATPYNPIAKEVIIMGGYYRFECKVVSRKEKRPDGSTGTNKAIDAASYITASQLEYNSINAAAYISGDKIDDPFSIKSVDYTNKNGVLYSNVVLNENAPERLKDPNILWGEVEQIEGNRKNATLYREFIVCFEKSLTYGEQIEIAETFAKSLVDEGMMACHYAIHNEKNDNGNYHAHFLMPCRGIKDGDWNPKKHLPRGYQLDEDGNRIPVIDKSTGLQKIDKTGRKLYKREPSKFIDAFNEPNVGNVERWRQEFAELENQYLSEEHMVSSLSYEKQGIDKIPGQHLPRAAYKMQTKLDNKINALSESERKEVLEEIIETVKSEYRRAYYTNSRELSKAKKEIEVDKSESYTRFQQHQQKIENILSKSSTYKPARKYILYNLGVKQEDIMIYYAMVEIINFLIELSKASLKATVEISTEALNKKIKRAEDDLIISYAFGMTSSIANRFNFSKYEMQKAYLKQIGQEIKEIESQINTLKEQETYDEQHISYTSVGRTRTDDPAITSGESNPRRRLESDARAINELAERLRECRERIAESSARITEFKQREEKLLLKQKGARIRR